MSNVSEQLRESYKAMETEELVGRVKSGTLTEEAHAIALEELGVRGVLIAAGPDVQQYKATSEEIREKSLNMSDQSSAAALELQAEEVRSFAKRRKWTVLLKEDGLQLFDDKKQLILTIPLSNVREAINFSEAFSAYNTVFKGPSHKVKLLLGDRALATLQSWIIKSGAQQLEYTNRGTLFLVTAVFTAVTASFWGRFAAGEPLQGKMGWGMSITLSLAALAAITYVAKGRAVRALGLIFAAAVCVGALVGLFFAKGTVHGSDLLFVAIAAIPWGLFRGGAKR